MNSKNQNSPQSPNQGGRNQGRRNHRRNRNRNNQHDPKRQQNNRPGSTSEQRPQQPVKPRLPEPERYQPQPTKRFEVIFFDTFMEAKTSLDQIREKRRNCDQLNIVIRADGDMDDPILSEFGKVFAGEAWTLIHKRRSDEGWYKEAH